MSGGGGTEEDRVRAFTDFRKRMNERILAEPNQVVRRFFALDTQTYKPGALDEKTKELLGLVTELRAPPIPEEPPPVPLATPEPAHPN